MSDLVHVVPLNDLKPHVEAGEWCHCKPRIENGVVIHNAYDGREFFEVDDREHLVGDDGGSYISFSEPCATVVK